MSPSPEQVAAAIADPLARGMVQAALAAADPERLVAEALESADRAAAPDLPPGPPTALFALGKAAAALARGAAGVLGLPLDGPRSDVGRPDTGFRAVLARPASSPPLLAGAAGGGPWEEWSGGHPLPDVDSMGAGHGLLRLLRSLGPDDHLLALVSGGGSACCEVPAGALSIADLVEAQRALLASGLAINRVNAVRKHLSRIKGGLALRHTAARVTVLVLSDVPGDDVSVVASGPFAPDPTTYGDALSAAESVLRRRDRDGMAPPFPAAALRHLEQGVAGGEPETLKPGDPEAARATHRLLAGPSTAGAAVAAWLEARGYRVERGELTGEAAGAGRELVRRGRGLAAEGPVALVLSGETVVHLDAAPGGGAPGMNGRPGRPPGTGGAGGPGSGGRNQELALAAAAELAVGGDGDGPEERVLAFATDGADGPTPAAGAWVDGATWGRLEAAGADPGVALRRHASHLALARLDGALLRTGTTGTNVADLAVYLRG